MGIRNRLLILLVTVALIPLLATAVLRQISIRVARERLTSATREALNTNARRVLEQLLSDRAEIFARERRLVDSLIGRQVREVEVHLANDPAGESEDIEFGLRPKTEPPRVGADSVVPPNGVDRRQQQLWARDADRAALAQDARRLQALTPAYQEIYALAPEGMLWLYTSLENGLHSTYPRGGALGIEQNDPRQQPWYLKAKSAGGIVRDGPRVDGTTGQAIMTISAPVRYPDGSLAGVTAMDRAVWGILGNLQLPKPWAEGAEKMLVVPIPPSDAVPGAVSILMHERHVDSDLRQQGENTANTPASEDHGQLQALVSDLCAGQPGVREMEHSGQEALWAYHPLDAGQAAILLIIPYANVTALAQTAGGFLLNESTFWLKITGLFLVGVAGAVMLLALWRARAFTEPIRKLTEANLRLAGGDYDTRVQIATRDELEELGRIFNETGSKLKERENLKKSLEIAQVIQQNLLPKTTPKTPGFDVAGRCVYCDETGGDYYDFITLPTSQGDALGIALGDVTGHGIGAALLMASVRSALRSEAQHYGPNLVGLFDELNRQVVRDTAEDKFTTLFYGLLDPKTRSLTWASAGHDPAVLYRKGESRVEELGNTGMLMGLIEDVPFQQAGPLSLEPGDILVVGTDGIWEARSTEGLLFGKDRLSDIICRERNKTAQALCTTVTDRVMEFIGAAPRTDDITLVVVKAT